MLPPSLLVVHDAERRRQDDMSELASRKEIDDPLLDLVVADIEARANDSALVDAANELNNNLAGAVIIHNFELTNVTCGKSVEVG